MAGAHRAHPERFIRKPPEPLHLPTGSWINPPDKPEEAAQKIPLDGCLIQVDSFRYAMKYIVCHIATRCS